MEMFLVLLSAILLAVVNGDNTSTQCYLCQSSGGVDKVCEEDPVNLPPGSQIACSSDKYCSIQRQWQIATDSMYFFRRDCSEKTVEEGCVTGVHYETCWSYCQGDLCNHGDGGDNSSIPSITTAPTGGTAPSQTTTTTAPDNRIPCLNCQTTGHPEEDKTCETSPEALPPTSVVMCPPERHCSVFRQWNIYEDRMQSFKRGCDTKDYEEGCTPDTYWLTCWSYCKGAYCNNGDGLPTSGGTVLKPILYITHWVCVLLVAVAMQS